MSSKSMDCELYNTYVSSDNSTTTLIIGFEGIPQNLVINICVFIFLVFIFIILRKHAWNYGQLAFLSNRTDDLNPSRESRSSTSEQIYTLLYGTFATRKCQDLKPRKGLLQYVPDLLFIRDNHLRKMSGSDAVLYQKFQLHIILLTICMCVLCLTVILPLNYHGTAYSDDSFAKTTVANISTEYTYYWGHLVLVILFFIVGCWMMTRFFQQVKKQISFSSQRTLMICGLSPDQCCVELLKEILKENVPAITIEEVAFTYNIKRLSELHDAKEMAEQALKTLKADYDQTGNRPTIVPKMCGVCCSPCCACVKRVDAIDFYDQQLNQFTAEFDDEAAKVIQRPINIAFVRLATKQEALMVLNHYNGQHTSIFAPSSWSCYAQWEVEFAPSADDIIWNNIAEKKWFWWIKAGFINLIVFIILIFFTTPTYVLNLIKTWDFIIRAEKYGGAILFRFLPSLILWAVSVLLPYIVYLSVRASGHWTRTTEAKVTMVKTYMLLIFMILILPSLGLTTIPNLLIWLWPSLANQPKNGTDTGTSDSRWNCVLLPSSGAFFINYVITASLIGTIVELIRFPDLIYYGYSMWTARSEVEQQLIPQKMLSRFDYGTSYAWLLCIFSVTSAYSVISPIIMPFGVLYQVVKYFIDRYNLFYAFAPCKTDKIIHQWAVTCTLVSLLFPQVNLLYLLKMKMDINQSLVMTSLISLILSIITVLFFIIFLWAPSSDNDDNFNDLDTSSCQTTQLVNPSPESIAPINSYLPHFLSNLNDAIH